MQFLKKPTKGRLMVDYAFDDEDQEDRNELDVDGLQRLWATFYRLVSSLKAQPGQPKYLNPDEFLAEARLGGTNFRLLTFDEDVIPYIHTMVYHIPHYLRKHRHLYDLGVDQVERKNFDQREAYFGATTRGGARHPVKVSVQVN